MTLSSSSSDSEEDFVFEETNSRESGINQQTTLHEDANVTSSDHSSSESEKSGSGNPVSGFLDSIEEFTSNLRDSSSTSSSVTSLSSFSDTDVRKKGDDSNIQANEKNKTQINENIHKSATPNVSETLQTRSSTSNESDGIDKLLSEDGAAEAKPIQITNDAQKAERSNVSLESKDPNPASTPAEPLFRALASEKAGNEIKERKKSESSLTSSSDLSDSSGDGDVTVEHVKPLIAKPPSATGSEKRRALLRPKTAKLPRTRNAREQKKTRVMTSSSSGSSVGSFEKERKSLDDEFQQQKKIELFLHRCLSEHLDSQLDKQRAYLDRSYAAPPLRTRRRMKRSDVTSRNSFRSEPRRTMTTQRTAAAILPSFVPWIREEDVRRNIEVLVAELARSENVKSMMRPPDLLWASQPRFRRRNRANQRKKMSSESESTSSNYTSSSSTNQKGENLSDESVSSEDEKSVKRNSILKKSRTNRDRAKHVTVVESSSERRPRADRSHLSSIFTSVGPVHYIMANNYGQPHHVILRPAPVQPNKRRPIKRVQKRKKKKGNEKKKKDCSDSESGKELERSKPQLEEETIEPGASPRIRPGTEPIKCNWKPEKPKAFELKCSDHQLKNSTNPAVLEWLAHKNELARRNRIYRFRENRTKRDRLMQEHNEREDKRANALIEYERWKKKKNREILLRRRREALDANASKIKDDVADQARNKKKKEPTITTFSDLRSSATTPHPPSNPPQGALVTSGGRRRPKSAPTKVSFGSSTSAPLIPVRIDRKNGDVTIMSPRSRNDVTNLSAREPMMQGTGDEKPNFMRELLEEKSPKSMFDIPPPGTFPQPNSEVESPKDGKSAKFNSTIDKDHYNNWVRSKGTSSPYQIRYKKKKTSSEPPHDPMTNELLSDLAKRRIKKIMDQKKRVDSGLRKKEEKIVEKPKEGRDAIKKWRLKEEPSVNLNLNRASRKRDRKLTGEERPIFSYNRKSKSKSIFHERNPVLNQALNT